MRVVIIGTGNVATIFGRLIKKAGHEIIQVYGRNISNAQLLANELQCPFTNDLKCLDASAGIYIVAVLDSSLRVISGSVSFEDKLVVHTAGSVSKDVLRTSAVNYGVMYPLQSLRKDNSSMQLAIPLLVDGSSEKVTATIEQLASTISSTVVRMNDEQRLKLHVAAVVVNNFTNYLYTLAADYCDQESIGFKMLQPLMEETAFRLRYHTPASMQTGPAVRKDINTIESHLLLLSPHPELKKIYLQMTESIMNAAV